MTSLTQKLKCEKKIMLLPQVHQESCYSPKLTKNHVSPQAHQQSFYPPPKLTKSMLLPQAHQEHVIPQTSPRIMLLSQAHLHTTSALPRILGFGIIFFLSYYLVQV